MKNDQLFKELCRHEVMQIGWYLAQADSRDDFVRDPVGHADFASDLTTRLSYLIEQVQTHRYRSRHLLEVEIPKSGLAVRPGNVLPIEEAALLHAVIYVLAPKLDGLLSSNVYSYRLHKNWKKKAKKGESMFKEGEVEFPFLKKTTINEFSPFESWYNQWPEFEAASKRAVNDDDFTHLTKTDISAYFENIDLRLLFDQIRGRLKRQEDKILQLLFRVLEGWRRTTSTGIPLGRGIPQGNEVSSFLGNFYLISLDERLTAFCKKHDATWFRYVDDVKVFTKQESHAREAVFAINEALRELHLNLQGSKTEILSGDALVRELDTGYRDRIAAARDAIAKESKAVKQTEVSKALNSISSLCTPFTTRLPSSVRGLKGEDSRIFRMLLSTYALAGRSRKGLPEAALHAIRELPDLRVLRTCLRYLYSLPYQRHEWVVQQLFDMLNAEELLFPYQVGSVLEALRDLHPDDPRATGQSIRQYALQRKRDWLIVTKGLEALSSFPYKEKYFENITAKFVGHDHPIVRRAAVAAIPRCKKDIARKQLTTLIRHPDIGVSRMAMWLGRLHTDREFSKKKVADMRKGNQSDHSIVLRLPVLYAASITEDHGIAKELLVTLNSLPQTKSSKLNWHKEQIRARLKWVDSS